MRIPCTECDVFKADKKECHRKAPEAKTVPSLDSLGHWVDWPIVKDPSFGCGEGVPKDAPKPA